MYKHECVNCLVEHKGKCIWNISFIDRFLGTESVLYCPEYTNIMQINKRFKRKK